MMLRIKVWPSPELAKNVFVVDGRVLEYRRVELDLRICSAVQRLTEYGRSLLWDDFKGSDPHAWERQAEITTSNIAAFTEDNAVLSEWVSHLFRESIANLNREWTAADPEALQARIAQAEIDHLAMNWDPSVVREDDPGF